MLPLLKRVLLVLLAILRRKQTLVVLWTEFIPSAMSMSMNYDAVIYHWRLNYSRKFGVMHQDTSYKKQKQKLLFVWPVVTGEIAKEQGFTPIKPSDTDSSFFYNNNVTRWPWPSIIILQLTYNMYVDTDTQAHELC